jgi:hypothetical protein
MPYSAILILNEDQASDMSSIKHSRKHHTNDEDIFTSSVEQRFRAFLSSGFVRLRVESLWRSLNTATLTEAVLKIPVSGTLR